MEVKLTIVIIVRIEEKPSIAESGVAVANL